MRSHSPSDLLRDRLDVALFSGAIDDEHLMARKPLEVPCHVYAAPALLERMGPLTVETLPDWPCLLGFDDAGRPETAWPLLDGGAVPVRGPIRANSMLARVEGAVLGMGLILGAERELRARVAAGELVPVLVDAVGHSLPIWLVWPPSPFLDPKVRAFIDLTTELLGRMVRERDARLPPSAARAGVVGAPGRPRSP